MEDLTNNCSLWFITEAFFYHFFSIFDLVFLQKNPKNVHNNAESQPRFEKTSTANTLKNDTPPPLRQQNSG